MNPLLLSGLAASVTLAMAAFPGHDAPNLDDPLAAYRDKARVLVVLAPTATDPSLLRQREIFAAMKEGAGERDLALLEAIGSGEQARALRRLFGLDESFHAVLVGKDGGDKLTASNPLGADQLFPLIDSMPMRQREMRKR